MIYVYVCAGSWFRHEEDADQAGLRVAGPLVELEREHKWIRERITHR